MSDTLFDLQVFTVHCFYGCGHKTQAETSIGSSDAMERHYWDRHYSVKDRESVRKFGQANTRMGKNR